MNLRNLKASLLEQGDKNLRFILPGGNLIPAKFHVTEVGHVAKKFLDCGGTLRNAEAVVLQVWVAEDDSEHRLTARKLAAILDLAKAVVPSDELNVEVEYESCAISQYSVDSASAVANELRFALVGKHTDCLAREACGLSSCGGETAVGATSGKCC